MDAEQREPTFLIATTEVEEKSPGGFSFCTSKKKKKAEDWALVIFLIFLA